MPPRISLPVRVRGANVCPSSSATASALRPFSTTPPNHTTTAKQRRRLQDPYAFAQANAKKAANLSRQEVLRIERSSNLGDPVRGVTTPFVQSFDTAIPQAPPVTQDTISKHTTTEDADQVPPGPEATSETYLNHFLTPGLVEKSLRLSDHLTTPAEIDGSDALREQQAHAGPSKEQIKEEQSNARAAIQRIISLANSSSRDRTHVNIERCIATFGRHNTDKVLPPKPGAQLASKAAVHVGTPPPVPVEGQADAEQPEIEGVPLNTGEMPLNPQALRRAGADTGSSEVQIAILTVRIRALANYLETRGGQDKMNKRNLRLLVHRRQKLMQYMRRKERGGPRWQYLIETLGLTEGTWRGEISL